MKNLFKRFYVISLAVCISGILLLDIIVYTKAKAFFVDNIKTELNSQMNLARKIINKEAFYNNNSAELKNFSDEIKRTTGLRTTLIDKNGVVIADSEIPLSELKAVENHLHRAEVQEAMSSGSGFSIRHSATIDKDLMYYCENIYQDNRIVGFIRFALFNEDYANKMSFLKGILILSNLIILSIFIIGVSLAHKHYKLQFNTLTDALLKTKNSPDYTPLPDQYYNEFNFISGLVNSIGDKLSETIKSSADRNSELLNVFNSMQDGVASFDKDGYTIFHNLTFSKILNIRNTEIKGLHFYEWIDFPPIINDINEYLQKSVPIVKRTKYYQNMFIEYEISPLKIEAGLETGILLTVRDITHVHKLETIRKDFVANVSHQFKTPLTAIRGYSETLLSGAAKNEEIRMKFLEKIRKQTYHLEYLINDLLQLSRIEKNEIKDLQKINPIVVIQEMTSDFEIHCRGKNLKFTADYSATDPNVMITINEDLLQTILSNLMVNAMKYNKENGEIRLTTRSTEELFSIEVEDTGIGISVKELDRIFERFYRTEQSTSMFPEGTGLGLSIVRNIVELLNGQITVESEPNKGSKFTINLPRTK